MSVDLTLEKSVSGKIWDDKKNLVCPVDQSASDKCARYLNIRVTKKQGSTKQLFWDHPLHSKMEMQK